MLLQYMKVCVYTPLALYRVGRTAGLFVNIGVGVTSVATVYEGTIIKHMITFTWNRL